MLHAASSALMVWGLPCSHIYSAAALHGNNPRAAHVIQNGGLVLEKKKVAKALRTVVHHSRRDEKTRSLEPCR